MLISNSDFFFWKTLKDSFKNKELICLGKNSEDVLLVGHEKRFDEWFWFV